MYQAEKQSFVEIVHNGFFFLTDAVFFLGGIDAFSAHCISYLARILLLKLNSDSISHIILRFDVRTHFPFFSSIEFRFFLIFLCISCYIGCVVKGGLKSERKGNCQHALRYTKCRPDILAEVHSLIFDHPSWDIFVGTMACGG